MTQLACGWKGVEWHLWLPLLFMALWVCKMMSS